MLPLFLRQRWPASNAVIEGECQIADVFAMRLLGLQALSHHRLLRPSDVKTSKPDHQKFTALHGIQAAAFLELLFSSVIDPGVRAQSNIISISLVRLL